MPNDTHTQLPLIIEALLFASSDPLSIDELHRIISLNEQVPKSSIYEALQELQISYISRAFDIKEIGGGFILQSKDRYGPYLEQLHTAQARSELSSQALEVLSIIVFRQPVTRPEIDSIRGIDSSHLVQQLVERGLIEPQGKKEVVGRPTLFGTTPAFLKHFGLRSLEDLYTNRN